MVADYVIESVVSRPFEQSTFILWKPGLKQALVVDPGFDPRGVLQILRDEGLEPAAILNTHGHVDHIAGNRPLKEAFPAAPLVIGRGESALLTDAEANMSAACGLPITSPPADLLVDDGDVLEIAGFRLVVREIPGHSPGSVVYLSQETSPPFVLGGDVVFAGSVGRTDLGGDFALLARGVQQKLWPLADETIIYPGHGPATTIGHEKRTNPFVGAPARGLDSPGESQ